MIRIENITAGYLQQEVLKDVSCNINNKDFFGIIGKNGAGKSTLLKVLCNLIKPYSGNVTIDNKNINSFLKRDFAKIISFSSQHIDTSMPFTVSEFVMFGRYPYMNTLKIPSKNDYAVIDNVMNSLNIKNFAERKVNKLSYGERQKVLIAQVLAQETNIIVFDEPTSHLDIGSQNKILEILRDLNEKYNKTIVLTLHDLNAAGEFCNKLTLMENGSICSCGTPEEVLNCKDIERVYNTNVVVKTNPISNKPYVIPVSRIKELRR
ncbi:MAG: ABC transporter ATP-binding protein [Endomicrobium sp.]|uniref:ABC transporter ATP-binding protein n=1 Tax=Candidatus Endomicrobiellum pyrsonymphae TaxID=1408203 RepID=UPI003572D5FD|nr:ABC transporter ATP-binding protein [Endomicrobium sp.]